MNAKVVECLAAQSEGRTINLLQNRQVRLQWDRIVLQLRMVDLLILNQALHAWLDDPQRAWARTYRLALNEYNLFLTGEDLYHFCAIVQAASEQLPRRTVRWADLTVTITPYGTPGVGEQWAMGSFSCN